jgi:Ca-activated chloride channel family protein
LPTQGETKIDKILTNVYDNRPSAVQLRLFPFGVGYDVNTDLLDTLSRELGGRSTYVQPEERIVRSQPLLCRYQHAGLK